MQHMNKPAWKTFLAAASICLAGLASLVAADSTTTNAPALRVGVAPVTPPMIYKEGAKVVGVEADFAQALGKEIGRPVTFVELPWQDLIDSLIADKIDIIMSSMSITRARQFRVTFSDPYLRIGQMALVRGSEQYRYGLLADSLAGKKVGVRKATTADLLVQQEFPRAKRKYFDTDEEGAIALKKGKIDLFMDDSTMVWYLAGVHEADGLGVAPLVFSEEYLGWAMKKSDTALQEAVGAFFKKNQASGELNKILHRWIPKLQ
jgi:polar amino acid transport system substrate-binding protein